MLGRFLFLWETVRLPRLTELTLSSFTLGNWAGVIIHKISGPVTEISVAKTEISAAGIARHDNLRTTKFLQKKE